MVALMCRPPCYFPYGSPVRCRVSVRGLSGPKRRKACVRTDVKETSYWQRARGWREIVPSLDRASTVMNIWFQVQVGSLEASASNVQGPCRSSALVMRVPVVWRSVLSFPSDRSSSELSIRTDPPNHAIRSPRADGTNGLATGSPRQGYPYRKQGPRSIVFYVIYASPFCGARMPTFMLRRELVERERTGRQSLNHVSTELGEGHQHRTPFM